VIGAAQRYSELLVDLLLQRENAGGALPQQEEARFAADLDLCWHAMTEEEQRDIETALTTRTVPAAPASLDIEDCAVERGATVTPRRAA
jgi:hypothetical protein